MPSLSVTDTLGIDIKVTGPRGLIGNVNAGANKQGLGSQNANDSITISPRNPTDHFPGNCDACVNTTNVPASGDTITFSMPSSDTSVTVGTNQNC